MVLSLIVASHVFLCRFWTIPSISSTQARSIRMWLWLPGTLHLTLSIYTRYAFILVIKCLCCLNWHYNKLPMLMQKKPTILTPLTASSHLTLLYAPSWLLFRQWSAHTISKVPEFYRGWNSLFNKQKKHFAFKFNLPHVAFSLNGFNYFAPFHYVGIFGAPLSVFVHSPFNFLSLIIELLVLKMNSD